MLIGQHLHAVPIAAMFHAIGVFRATNAHVWRTPCGPPSPSTSPKYTLMPLSVRACRCRPS
jgi:hypothetical protein